ncbi:hypothetical protein DMB37_38450 [Nocardia sp. CS682]|nr:hypothetical protein DMB37_38450 [Nocardia sp. CS682]
MDRVGTGHRPFPQQCDGVVRAEAHRPVAQLRRREHRNPLPGLLAELGGHRERILHHPAVESLDDGQPVRGVPALVTVLPRQVEDVGEQHHRAALGHLFFKGVVGRCPVVRAVHPKAEGGQRRRGVVLEQQQVVLGGAHRECRSAREQRPPPPGFAAGHERAGQRRGEAGQLVAVRGEGGGHFAPGKRSVPSR